MTFNRNIRCLIINVIIIIVAMINVIYIPTAAHAQNTEDQELSRKVNEYMEQTMAEHHIAGAVLVIVKDGQIVMNQGYGYADIENEKLVDPNTTMFRIGSVTKTFTTIAALQQVEQERLRMDQDVNSYLSEFKVENPYSIPLTLSHLLTQTSGLSETMDGVYTDVLTDEPVPLSQTLKQHMPAVVRPPGEVVQYSNFGYALIGHLVEQTSGESFDQYVEKYIFNPLEMENTIYSITPAESRVSKGYLYENGGFAAKPFGNIVVHPAGSISSTASDMGKFIQSQLQNGAFNNQQILSKETAIDMRKRHFTVQETMPGYGYGYYENFKNSNILVHDGDIDTFTSQLSLYPKANLGYFVSYNTLDDGLLREGIEDVIYSHYGVSLNQESANVKETNQSQAEDVSSFDGSYVFAQRFKEGPLKSRGLFLKVKIKETDNGSIRVRAFDSSVGGEYHHAGDHLYINADNGRRLYLKEDPEGQQYLIINMKVPIQTLEKLNKTEVFMENVIRPFVFGIAILVFLVGIVQFFRRKRNKNLDITARRVRHTSKLLNLLILSLGICMILVMFTQSDHFRGNVLVVVLVISILILLSSIMLLVYLFKLISNGQKSWFGVLYYALLILSGGGSLVYAAFLDLY